MHLLTNLQAVTFTTISFPLMGQVDAGVYNDVASEPSKARCQKTWTANVEYETMTEPDVGILIGHKVL